MSKRNIFSWVLILAMSLITFSCKDEKNEPTPETKDLTKNIVGKWLLSTSNDSEWITYEFTETSRVKAEFYENGTLKNGAGFYWVNEDNATITGSYEVGARSTYIDWAVDKIQPFELSIKLYDNNQYLADASIYRILSTKEVEAGNPITIDFKAICGTDRVSNLNIIDESVATVESDGSVNGLHIGSTFLTFDTSKGTAAIVLQVNPKSKSFAELAVGTWIYDNLSEKEWQRTTFVADGYVSAEWTNPMSYNTIESGNGYYTISGENVIWSITTAYNRKINQEWRTEELNDFIWTYNCYSDGSSVGKYTGQRLLGSITIEPEEKATPKYDELTFGYSVVGYSSHNSAVATVNSEGEITAVAPGRTYIDVKTSNGAGVYEVYVVVRSKK